MFDRVKEFLLNFVRKKKYLLIFRYMFGHIVTLIYIVNYLIEEH